MTMPSTIDPTIGIVSVGPWIRNGVPVLDDVDELELCPNCMQHVEYDDLSSTWDEPEGSPLCRWCETSLSAGTHIAPWWRHIELRKALNQRRGVRRPIEELPALADGFRADAVTMKERGDTAAEAEYRWLADSIDAEYVRRQLP